MTLSNKFSDSFLDPRSKFQIKETSGTIRSVFISNRGEVAHRIIRSLRRMEIRSVTAYEPGDEHSLHVVSADETVFLNTNGYPSVFLDPDLMIQTALEHQCDAIHPGWGYLSENPEFIQKCEDAGLIFIGPKPETVSLLGNKISARKLAQDLNIPTPGGSEKPVASVKEAKKLAKKIGLPVLLKASAGGGGRGIRVIRDIEDIERSFPRAQSEALNAFGNGDIFVEAFLEDARHIEVQVLGDQFGTVYALGTRDCSIQRRRQKVIEEAEAIDIPDSLRARLCESAIAICEAANYCNAGTVEFLVTRDGHFVFLEVNTRLQVEHPVTEAVIGQDLVWLQVLIAAGHPIPANLENLVPLGHAIEVRVLAEDARLDFAPKTGLVRHIDWPTGNHVRVETALVAGSTIGLKYDPMIAKIICWGRNRNEAIDRMACALEDTRIIGVATNVHLLRSIMDHPEFQIGRIHTNCLEVWVKEYQEGLAKDPALFDGARAAAYLWANPNRDSRS